jgi:hypothetical protein
LGSSVPFISLILSVNSSIPRPGVGAGVNDGSDAGVGASASGSSSGSEAGCCEKATADSAATNESLDICIFCPVIYTSKIGYFLPHIYFISLVGTYDSEVKKHAESYKIAIKYQILLLIVCKIVMKKYLLL